MRRLTLFIPKLFGAPSFDLIPDCPSLMQIFRFSTVTSAPATFSETLFRLFDFPSTSEERPVAAVTHLIDDNSDDGAIWMRADPVHLRVARDAVVLLDETSFRLEKRETLCFAASLQEIFAEHAIVLQTPTDYRWYLKLTDRPHINMVPIHDVVGDDIRHHRCSGDDRLVWERLATSVQMCLHDCPINQSRELRGELPINGLWMWGMGSLPPSASPVWSCVFSDDVITRGLSAHCHLSHAKLPENINTVIEQTASDGQVLAVITSGMKHVQYLNQKKWCDFICDLEGAWFATIWRLIKHRELDELMVLTGTHRLRLKPLSLLKRWRRQHTFTYYR